MKRVFIAFGVVALTTAAVFAGRATVFATATDLYAKKALGTCQRVVTQVNILQPSVQTSAAGSQAIINSNGGTSYQLFEDASCTRAIFYTP